MFIALLLVAVTAVMAYANGANDNFKGVATLYGSRTVDFLPALHWANATTLAGALTAVVLGHGLARNFGGGGLVPEAVVRSAPFLVSVGLSAAATVLLATRLGLPVSTTHALLGSLAGAGVAAAPGAFNWSVLGGRFLLPLLLSPFVAFVATLAIYP
ncbi:inorganic phosphate transporter, partial [Candidatus Poribacteria bacterium]|nr:inorganic phosphate transporter [Candidatus Poribacteria bacterium]